MFSSRLRWDSPANALAQRLAEKRTAGARILDLTQSNPTVAGFHYPDPEILAAIADSRALRYEPDPRGLLSAREAIAGYYAGRGHSVPADRILLTASTSEAYTYLFKLLCDPGDEILIPCPSYPLFEFLASLEAVRTVQYPLVYHEGWFLDRDALASAVTRRTRAVVLVNPNNPTGSFLKHDEWEWLSSFCLDRGLAVISDEVFADYAFQPDPRRVGSLVGAEGPLVFCMSGLSKLARMPQMKLGWIVAGRQAMGPLELIADTYLSVSTPVQHAAARLLDAGRMVQEQIRARTRSNLAGLRLALKPLEVEGAWSAIVRMPRVKSEEEYVLELLDRDTLVQPGFFYDFDQEAFLVVSLLPPEADFTEGVQRIAALV
jgi:hypothetical protein